MKKIIKILIPTFLIGLIFLIAYDIYNDTIPKQTNPISLVPNNAGVIVQVNNLPELSNSQKSNIFWNELSQFIPFELFNNKFEEKLNEDLNKIIISAHKIGNNKNAVLYITNITDTDIKEKTLSSYGKIINKIKYDNKTLFHVKSDTTEIYYSFENDLIFFSKNQMLIEDVIKKNKTQDKILSNTSFKKLYQTTNESAVINLFVNFNSLSKMADIYTKEKIYLDDFSSWVASDIKIQNNAIIINGFTDLNSPPKDYTDILKNQVPQKINISKIAPESTTMMLILGFDKPSLLFENKNKLLQRKNNFWSWDKERKKLLDSTKVEYTEILKDIGVEAGKFKTFNNDNKNSEYTFFKSNNSINTSSLLQGLIHSKEEYKSYSLNLIKDPNLVKNLFGEVLNYHNPYYTIIEDYFIFGHSKASIKHIIDNYIAENTLYNTNHFKSYDKYISSSVNLLYYINPGKTLNFFTKKLKNNFKEKIQFNNDSIKYFTGFSIEFSNKRNLLMNNMSLYYDSKYNEEIKEEWFIELDTLVNSKPQFVKNHFTKEKMILIQTLSNKLYAIDKEGAVIWTKDIKDQIIGDINEIDVYKNNKYQAIFNTKNKLHIIDRKGRYVDGFPIKLPSSTRLGHALFDYDNKKRYRILIIGEDNFIYNLNSEGKKVPGWKYRKDKNRITHTPLHFKINNKDYILKQTINSTSNLLAINGTNRINFNSSSIFNGSKFNIDQLGTVHSITADGKLWRGKLNGDATELSLEMLNNESILLVLPNIRNSSNRYVISSFNNLIIMDENFSILNSFNLKNKIKNISMFSEYIISSTNNELYILKNNEMIEGFPMETNGYYNVDDIENNNKINIINCKENTVFNYEIEN